MSEVRASLVNHADMSGGQSSRKAGRKAPDAYRTISEVADLLHVPQHVLRFWETRFDEVSPLKSGGGRRYYSPEQIELLRRISELLYVEGYTIKGVQRLLKGNGQVDAAVPLLSMPHDQGYVSVAGFAEDGAMPFDYSMSTSSASATLPEGAQGVTESVRETGRVSPQELHCASDVQDRFKGATRTAEDPVAAHVPEFADRVTPQESGPHLLRQRDELIRVLKEVRAELCILRKNLSQ